VLGVARSADDAWARRGVAARAQAAAALTAPLAATHARRRRTAGAPRVPADLRAAGVRGARKRVARRRRVRTTGAAPPHTPAPKLVARDCAAPAPDVLWRGESTSLPTGAGWRSLAVLLAAHARRVGGWALADHRRAALALDALAMARQARRPPPGLVHHPDRGCQDTAAASPAALARHGRGCAMRRSGTCRDHALAARCFATRKAELAEARPWPTRAAARTAVFAWLAVWDRRQRRHSALNYQPPVTFAEDVVWLSSLAA
jgi:transposase InsO family protein